MLTYRCTSLQFHIRGAVCHPAPHLYYTTPCASMSTPLYIIVQVCEMLSTAQNMAFVHFVGSAPRCSVKSGMSVYIVDQGQNVPGTGDKMSLVPGTKCPRCGDKKRHRTHPRKERGTGPRAGREGSPLGRDPPATAPPPARSCANAARCSGRVLLLPLLPLIWVRVSRPCGGGAHQAGAVCVVCVCCI